MFIAIEVEAYSEINISPFEVALARLLAPSGRAAGASSRNLLQTALQSNLGASPANSISIGSITRYTRRRVVGFVFGIGSDVDTCRFVCEKENLDADGLVVIMRLWRERERERESAIFCA